MMVLSLFLQHFELRLESLLRWLQLQQIGEQPFKREMLSQRLEQNVFGSSCPDRRIKDLLLGRHMHRKPIGSLHEKRMRGSGVVGIEHFSQQRFHFFVLADEKLYRFHEDFLAL